MAMNKSEKELVESLHTKLALRVVQESPVPHDVPVPKSFEGNISGFVVTGSISMSLRVANYLSSSHGHSKDFHVIPTKTSSQSGITGYSTKLLALKEMRYRVEMAAAKELRRIDVEIEQELLKAQANSDCACRELGSECFACEVEE